MPKTFAPFAFWRSATSNEQVGLSGSVPFLPSVAYMPVRNTFIEYPVEHKADNEFYEERTIRSCPPTIGGDCGGGDGGSQIAGAELLKGDMGMVDVVLLEEIEELANRRPSTVDGSSSSEGGMLVGSDADSVNGLRVLSLEALVPPSVGSALHAQGRCRPCAFVHRKEDSVTPGGCSNGKDCGYCHLCPPGEIRRRKKEKLRAWRDRRFLKRLMLPLGLLGSRLSPERVVGGGAAAAGTPTTGAAGQHVQRSGLLPLPHGGAGLDALRAQFRTAASIRSATA